MHTIRHIRSTWLGAGLGAGLLAALLTTGAGSAETLPAAQGEVILSVSGAISTTNGDGVLALDADLLATLPQHAFTTATIWTEGTATYSGVLLRDLLAAAGATGATVKLTALNDYQIAMPAADAATDGPLLAYLADGQPMSIRDKGPVWLIYPFDDVAAYRTEQTYARSIWQLNRIEITD
ncbi:molybdopterin-dependent oxidoreductase [Fertoebacter nigrum]|uniref:Molybdopterin-dependent oxidoreductase n=1 Tax=Fertoeibacter niger TaxID=2656921 RepID=A0A8X8KMJ8_9RHOB|nr:molybdopterin-dependent oxidoreductase [Fertoeibacter niger]NUB46459.1 molybdopterin-dependent oxidoreductase [Fertoeibacter niger]